MQVGNEFGRGTVGVYQALGDFTWMRCGVTDPFQCFNFGNCCDEQRQIRGIAIIQHAAVGIYILAQQSDFPHALRDKARNFGQYISKWPRNFFAARIGDNAECAIFGTALHD